MSTKRLGIAVIIVLVLVGQLGLLYYVFSNRDVKSQLLAVVESSTPTLTETPTETPTHTPTETLTPTVEPSLTATPTPNTEATTPLVPTETLTPTITQQPALTPSPTAGQPRPTPTGGNNLIMFSSNRDGDWELYVTSLASGILLNLTNNEVDDQQGVWSPDGSQIAYMSKLAGKWDIWLMDADGLNKRNLTATWQGDSEQPSWSPDGSKLAFSNNQEVYILDLAINQGMNITNSPEFDGFPAWSPDGTQLVFRSNRDGNREIYRVNADGSNPIRLTNDTASDDHPIWSPDGLHIIFQSTRGSTTPTTSAEWQIYIMDNDGANLHLVSQLKEVTVIADPSFSPDGQWITFFANPAGNYDIYIQHLETDEVVRVTQDTADERYPQWMP